MALIFAAYFSPSALDFLSIYFFSWLGSPKDHLNANSLDLCLLFPGTSWFLIFWFLNMNPSLFLVLSLLPYSPLLFSLLLYAFSCLAILSLYIGQLLLGGAPITMQHTYVCFPYLTVSPDTPNSSWFPRWGSPWWIIVSFCFTASQLHWFTASPFHCFTPSLHHCWPGVLLELLRDVGGLAVLCKLNLLLLLTLLCKKKSW